MTAELLTTRPMGPADRNFVLSSWLHSHGRQYRSRVRGHMLSRYRHEVERRVRSGKVLIACSPESRSTIHGWICGEGRMVHYVYVPFSLRRNGIARTLITALLGDYPARVLCTHPWPWPSSRYLYLEGGQAA